MLLGRIFNHIVESDYVIHDKMFLTLRCVCVLCSACIVCVCVCCVVRVLCVCVCVCVCVYLIFRYACIAFFFA